MKWFAWLLSRWREQQRSIDLEILWPACKKVAPDLTHAKVAFAVHAFSDEAWTCLGEAEIRQRIDELK